MRGLHVAAIVGGALALVASSAAVASAIVAPDPDIATVTLCADDYNGMVTEANGHDCPGISDHPITLQQGWRFLGDWNGGALYHYGDVVQYSGGTYLALADNSILTPVADSSHWASIGSAGARGPAGPAGARGARGPQGPAGSSAGLSSAYVLTQPTLEGNNRYVTVRAGQPTRVLSMSEINLPQGTYLLQADVFGSLAGGSYDTLKCRWEAGNSVTPWQAVYGFDSSRSGPVSSRTFQASVSGGLFVNADHPGYLMCQSQFSSVLATASATAIPVDGNITQRAR